MKIQCNEFNEATEHTCTVHLKEKKIYHVFGMNFEPSRGVLYRIMTSYEQPGYATMALFPSTCFTVISTVVPSNWRLEIHPSGAFFLAPKAWLQEGFYEAFYDSVESDEVYKIFERERDIIIAEDPL